MVSSARAQTLVPPRVLALPDIVAPEGTAPPPSGAVELTVVIDASGHGTVASSDAPEPWRTLAAEAIARGRFAPATRDGQPVPSRVRVRLAVQARPEPAASSIGPTPGGTGTAAAPSHAATGTPTQASHPHATRAVTSPAHHASAAPPEFGASATVAAEQPTRLHLSLAQVRDMPGTFGDPFRAIESLPGVVPILTGVPYVYVRGAPPAGTIYYYDDIPLPELFHLALGPAVIHPAMIGPIDFYPGVAPARYGRHTGGVIVGEGPSESGPLDREIELRLIDVNGIVQAPVGHGGRVTISGRYGYPGLLLSVLSPDASLAYWDYQARLTLPVGAHDRFELVALGAYDEAGAKSDTSQNLSLQFHRIDARFLHRRGPLRYGADVLFGWDQSQLGNTFRAQTTSLSPRVWLEWHGGRGTRMRVGADMRGAVGDLTNPSASSNPDGDRPTIDNPLYAGVAGREVYGAYVESELRPSHAVGLELGLRGDMWVTNVSGAETAVDSAPGREVVRERRPDAARRRRPRPPARGLRDPLARPLGRGPRPRLADGRAVRDGRRPRRARRVPARVPALPASLRKPPLPGPLVEPSARLLSVRGGVSVRERDPARDGVGLRRRDLLRT